MKLKKTLIRICLLVTVVLSLSLLSLTAYAAAEQQTENTDNSSAETVITDNDYALLRSEITGKKILIAVGVSVGGTGIVVFLIWHSYKTNGQSEPYTYKKNAPLELTEAEDVHVDTIVNRRKIERDQR